jgi:citrate lyase subunit beta / citryl-CoA lyase
MTTAIRPRRSALYMPASNARALEKARTLPADVIILDLEDAVAPDAKKTAREQAAAAIKAKGFGPREVVLRTNGLDTAWIDDDLAAAVAAGPDAVLVPKISSPEEVAFVAHKLADLKAPPSLAMWAMIETPLGVLDANFIAAAGRDPKMRLAVLVLGTNDIAKETRARIVPGRLPMLAALSTVILAARAHGLDVLDGVFNDIQDAAGFARECEDGRNLGFDGKTLIHPSQVEPCNAAYSPAEAEVAQAKKIVAAFAQPENAGKGVITVDGRMVELLHAEIARRTVALHDAIAARA